MSFEQDKSEVTQCIPTPKEIANFTGGRWAKAHLAMIQAHVTRRSA
jgi:hypothetical protein